MGSIEEILVDAPPARAAVVLLQHFVHRRLIWIVSLSYLVAGLLPDFGLWMRGASFEFRLSGASALVSLPPLMLACLLFNAGLGVRLAELNRLRRRPAMALVGAVVNIAIPLAYILLVHYLLAHWHNPGEAQEILVGLALVAAMPIAGASTAWAQNANGNLALSLGLVLLTTAASPLLTPAAFHAVGFLTVGDYAEDLHELASNNAVGFLGLWVIFPSFLGVAAGHLIGEARFARVSVYVKLANYVILILLNYANAALTLPQALAKPDYDFFGVMLLIVCGLCFAAFASGFVISRFLRAGRAETASLMFGLGMNNNGAGLVLASVALADHPNVMLPVIFYNLTQHFVAAIVDRLLPRLSMAQNGVD